MIVQCPRCSRRASILSARHGKRVRCTRCGNNFNPVPHPEIEEALRLSEKLKQDTEALFFEHPPQKGTDAPQAQAVSPATEISSAASRIWKPGDVILGLYTVNALIGEGGMGTVHRVHHQGWKMDLAVKSPRPESLADPRMKRLFIREAEAWVDLGLHPNIASCFYVREIDGMPRIFIEYVEGGSLKDWMSMGRVKTIEQGIDLAIQLCDGMQHAHSKGLIHRDLKPGNCLMTESGLLKITDFGLVKWSAEEADVLIDEETQEPIPRDGKSVSLSGDIAGTPEYMSPEQWESLDRPQEAGQVGLQSDIYSFGVLFYEMLCGVRPFDDGDVPLITLCHRHLNEAPPAPESHRPDIPPSLISILLKTLEKKPADRFQSFSGIRTELVKVYEDAFKAPYPRTPPSAARLAADSLNNRAISFCDLGRLSDALSALEDALKADPSHLETNYNHSLLEWRAGHITDEEVVSRLEEIRNSRAGSWRAAYLLGLVHQERRDAKSACAALDSACRSEGVSPMAWIAYGDALLGAGQTTDAIRAFQMAHKRQGNVHEIRRRSAVALHLAGQKQRAELLWGSPIGQELVSHVYRSARIGLSFPGHEGPIAKVALSHDGRVAVSIGPQTEPSLRVWNIRKGECLFSHGLEDAFFTCVALSPNGTTLLAGDSLQRLHYLDVLAQKPLITSEPHKHDISFGFILNRQDMAITAGKDGSVSFWSLPSLKLSRVLRRGPKIEDIALDERGNLAVTTNGASLYVWEFDEGKNERFVTPALPLSCVAVSGDGHYALTGGSDHSLRLWDVKNRKILRKLEGHSGAILSVAMSPDAQLALSIGRDNRLCVWIPETGQCLFGLEAFAGHAAPIALSEDKRVALWGGWDKQLHLIDLGTPWPAAPLVPAEVVSTEDALQRQRLVDQLRERAQAFLKANEFQVAADFIHTARKVPGYERDAILTDLWNQVALGGRRVRLLNAWRLRTFQHTKAVTSVALSHDNAFVLSGDQAGGFRQWNVRSGEITREFSGHSSSINTLAISDDAGIAITGSGIGRGGDTTVRVWELATGKEMACLQCIQGVSAVSISPDKQFVLVGTREVLREAPLRLWDIPNKQLIGEVEELREAVSSVAFHPSGHLGLCGFEDASAILWSIPGLRRLRVFEGHRELVSAVAFSPDGQFVLTASLDGHALLTHLYEQGKVLTLEARAGISSAAFSPNGQFVCAGMLDGAITIWSAITGELIRLFEGHSQEVESVVFSREGRYVLSGSSDRTMILWELDWEVDFPTPSGETPELVPWLNSFLWRHSTEGSAAKPQWAAEDFEKLLCQLSRSGLGWIPAEMVRETLDGLSPQWKPPEFRT